MSATDRRIDAPVILNEIGMSSPVGYVVNLDNYDTLSFHAVYSNMTATTLEFNVYSSNDGLNFDKMVDWSHLVTADGSSVWDLPISTARFLQFLAIPTGGSVDLIVTFYARRH